MNYIDHKYIRLLGPQLEQFKQKTEKLYNFRCPICGDSQKSKIKARGYAFEHKGSLLFKCHNCSISLPIGKLIEHLDPTLYKAYIFEKFKENITHSPKKKKRVSIEELYKADPPRFRSINPLSEIGAIKLTKCDTSHSAIRFAESRMIPSSFYGDLYYLDDEEKLEQLSEKYKDRIVGHASRILIPYYNEHDEFIGVTGRAIDPKNNLRYLTLKLSDAPMIYGLNRVNKRKKVYVVEGPIDSLFLPNGIAVSGSDFSKLGSFIPKENCVIIFDNEPRNKDLHKQMKRIIDEGYSICIWPENIIGKDINDMILAGETIEEILAVINKNNYENLGAYAALQNWKKI